jgi:hypothetical protein
MFEFIQMYLNKFTLYLNILYMFLLYFNVLSVYSNVFECLYNIFQYVFVPIGSFNCHIIYRILHSISLPYIPYSTLSLAAQSIVEPKFIF